MTAPAPAAPWWKRYAKAVFGGLATLSPSVVVGVLALFGVDIDTDSAVLICGVLGALLGGATVARVGNAEPPPKVVVRGVYFDREGNFDIREAPPESRDEHGQEAETG